MYNYGMKQCILMGYEWYIHTDTDCFPNLWYIIMGYQWDV
jgi:hypothetical protein